MGYNSRKAFIILYGKLCVAFLKGRIYMHRKKMIAPIVISSLLLLYYIGFFAVLMWIDKIPVPIKILLGVIPALLAGVVIFVLVERIKEIRSGEEDDLGKY